MTEELIVHQNKILAKIIYDIQSISPGIQFFTADENSLQIGQHAYQAGKLIKPHKHQPVKIQLDGSMQEVLYIQEGKVLVTFYDDGWNKVDQKTIQTGDVILLKEGGHSFEFLEQTKMLEIKQGPFNPKATERMESK